MRVVGLLLVMLAGPALAFDERHAAPLARFAYANTFAFRTSLADMSPMPAPEPLLAVADSATLPDLHPVGYIAAANVLDAPVDMSERAITLLADGIEALPLVRDVELLAAPRPARQRLAALSEPPTEIIATEAKPDAPEVQRGRTRSRASGARLRRTPKRVYARARSSRKSPAKQANGVPRWAMKMFAVTWQPHAFAYQ